MYIFGSRGYPDLSQFYDRKYITLDDLPAVVDDFKNAKHTIKMMGILPENTFEMKDVTYHEIEEFSVRIHAIVWRSTHRESLLLFERELDFGPVPWRRRWSFFLYR